MLKHNSTNHYSFCTQNKCPEITFDVQNESMVFFKIFARFTTLWTTKL